jgi:hypothetical protein
MASAASLAWRDAAGNWIPIDHPWSTERDDAWPSGPPRVLTHCSRPAAVTPLIRARRAGLALAGELRPGSAIKEPLAVPRYTRYERAGPETGA